MKFFKISSFVVCILFISGYSGPFSLKKISQNTSPDDFNIVLITIDTLRADHLSCYGYERETSPHIDKVAEKGILFKNVIAPSSWTAPSMVSLFTSTYPINHGVIHGLQFREELKKRKRYSQAVFSHELATLPEILKKQGYTTFGVSSNHNLKEKLGFARGFDYFTYRGYHLRSSTAKHINELVYRWEDKIKKSDKYFLWIHYMDPHEPYIARAPWIVHYALQSRTNDTSQARSKIVARYDSEINYVDSYVGELIQKFELDKKTLLIITSDHGEQFLEHGRIGHSLSLHQEEIHVPLIIQLPGASEMVRIENQASLLDIVPTILHILDTDPPEQTIGKVLLQDKSPLNWLKTLFSRRGEARYIFSELDKNSTLKAIITPAWKYIYNYKNKTDQLYRIQSDPNEHSNLAVKNPTQCNQLKKELLNWVPTAKTYPVKNQSFELSQEEKEKLEAIGYLDAQTPERKRSQERLVTKKGRKDEREVKESAIVENEKASLKIIDLSDHLLGIQLTNTVPVRGVQFTLEGVKISEVRTTAHTKGFLADFNSASGAVIIISASGDKIKTGKNLIVEVVYEMAEMANLSKIKIVK
jgi:arylsulfatase A-like enzyme